MSRKSPLAQRGWTLMEVTAVLLLLGIVSAVILYQAGDTGVAKVAGQTEALKSQLRYAQSRAMNSNVRYGLHFDTSGGITTYNLYRVNTSVPGNEEALAMAGQDVSITLPGGVYVSSPSGEFYVSFDDWGAPYQGHNPASPLSSTLTLTVSGPDADSRTITIHPRTGFIP
ncbi:MAG: type II secretion system protein [Thermodesulfobacteriota bacterium]